MEFIGSDVETFESYPVLLTHTVGARRMVIELRTSMRMVAGSIPRQAGVASYAVSS